MLVIPPFKECKYGSHHFFFYIEATTIIFQRYVAENWMLNDLKPLYFPSGNVCQLKCTYFFLYCKDS